MSRLREMEVFVRVVETGSFSAAARDFKVGQPAISKSITSLETRLGIRLLARSTRRLTPTEAGKAFYERAFRALAEANEAEAAAQSAGKGLSGRLRLYAPVTFARLHLVPRLHEFLGAHPKLDLEVVMDDRSIDLLAENIDVAIRMGALADSALKAKKIASGDRLVLASPDYLRRRGIPSRPFDLRRHEAVIYNHGTGGEEWLFTRHSSSHRVRIQGRLALTAAEGVRAAVIAGQGFTVASRWMFQPEIASGEVVPILTEWELPQIDLWIVYPSGRLTSTKARTFALWFQRLIG
ncbi:LysR family transcriptional regulator [Terriglobus albidus]|uniref:LysR family transcriptional regulator n=1 Tax=Terriglobus albidus TaxID=1592106 RepID=UPI0021E0F8AD|nr:LysR family transcriptional regulator [Terriglobus albidus]